MINIIVLEDDVASAALVAHIVKKNGGKARTAARVADAWRHLVDEPADLVVVDTDLGGEWGWELVEKMRRSVVFSEVPVVVYSAVWRREVVRRYMSFGVQGMIVKPYTPDRLMKEMTQAAEAQWREPFFDFPALPKPADGAEQAARYRLLAEIHAAAPETAELAVRLAGNHGDIASQEKMAAVGRRARAAGFNLLGEIAEKLTVAAIEAKLERVEVLVDDLTAANRILARLFGVAEPTESALPTAAVVAEPVQSHGAVARVPAVTEE